MKTTIQTTREEASLYSFFYKTKRKTKQKTKQNENFLFSKPFIYVKALKTKTKNKKSLLTTDVLVLVTMKNAAKRDM